MATISERLLASEPHSVTVREAVDTIDALVAALEEEMERARSEGLWPNPRAQAALALARGEVW